MTVAVSQRALSSAPSSVASSTSAVTILVANTERSGATVFNEGTATLFLHLGTGASATVYTAVLQPGGYYEVPYGYTGALTGYWSAAAAGNNARVVEFS